MTIKIRKRCMLEILLLLLYGFYVLLAHWIWFGRGIQETVMIVLSLLVLIRSARIQRVTAKALPDIMLVLALFVVCLCGVLRSDTHTYLLADLKSMLGTIIVSISVIQAIKHLERSGYELQDFLFSFLNGYFVLNDILIVTQYFVPYFLMNRKAITSSDNAAYYDQLTGLLGINGTTRWDIWTTAIIILNFHVAYRRNDRRIIRYNIFFIAASMVISMLNSARAFLIIAPATIVIYLFLIRNVRLTGRMRQILAIFGVLIIGLAVYLSNTYINQFVNNLIEDKFAIYMSGDIKRMVAANDDRAIVTYYAINNCGKWGVGIGTTAMHAAMRVSRTKVKFMGINSASSYIYMIGVAGYFLWTICLARVATMDRNRSLRKTAGYFVYLLVLGYFLPIYSGMALFPAIMYIFYIFDLEHDYAEDIA